MRPMKPLGTVDTSFLLIENRTMPMHTAGLMLFSYPEGAHEDWLHQAFSANDDPDAVSTVPSGFIGRIEVSHLDGFC